MSDFEPLEPVHAATPGLPSQPQLPTPPPGGPPPWQGPPQAPLPAGYQAYGAVGQPQPEPRGWRTTTLVGFVAVTAFSVLIGVEAFRRSDLAERYFAGSATLDDLQRSDDRVKQLAFTLIGLQLVAAAALAVWANLTTKAAARREPRAVLRPGLAAGSWFIPFVNYVLPWKLLRSAARTGRPVAPSAISWWQGLFIAQAVVGIFTRAGGELRAGMSQDTVISTLNRQGWSFVVSAVFLLAATLVAAVAMRQIDRATCGTAVAG